METLRKNSHVVFLGEQDGVVERELKTELLSCFTPDMHVSAAFLARVSYEDVPGPHVTLCIRGNEQNASELVQRIGSVFAKQFNSTQKLDIFFMSETQLEAIKRVAKPFYSVLPQ
jgi:hypothetical protein